MAGGQLAMPLLACWHDADCRLGHWSMQEQLERLSQEYDVRVAAVGVNARISAERAWATQRDTLQHQVVEAEAGAAAAEQRAAEEVGLAEQRGAEELAQQDEGHRAELAAVQEECTRVIEEREVQHVALLAELRALRSAMSSRASTRQEQHASGMVPTAPPSTEPWQGFGQYGAAAGQQQDTPPWASARQQPRPPTELMDPPEELEKGPGPQSWQWQQEQRQEEEWQPRAPPQQLRPMQAPRELRQQRRGPQPRPGMAQKRFQS